MVAVIMSRGVVVSMVMVMIWVIGVSMSTMMFGTVMLSLVIMLVLGMRRMKAMLRS